MLLLKIFYIQMHGKHLLHDRNDDLKKFRANLAVEVKSTFIIVYDQEKANDMMRTAIFQRGRSFTADEDYNRDVDRCQFTARFKKSRDVHVPKYTEFMIHDIGVHSINEKQSIITYSFVNSSSGEKGDETSDLIPFALECVVDAKRAFTYKMFRLQVGHRMELVVK